MSETRPSDLKTSPPTGEPPSQERREKLRHVLDHFGFQPVEKIWPLLNRAMIHRSYRTEAGLAEDNERLEFLGDSVIGLICTEYLVHEFPDSDEGQLSKLRATIVSRLVLGRIAQDMGLGDLMLFGAGEERSGGRGRQSLLGSALEAVCGALFLIYPWTQVRESLVSRLVVPALEISREDQITDFKSQLQEWAQREYQTVPEYRVIDEGGPDHLKTFKVEVSLGGQSLGVGAGKRKKLAENEAARQALDRLRPASEENESHQSSTRNEA